MLRVLTVFFVSAFFPGQAKQAPVLPCENYTRRRHLTRAKDWLEETVSERSLREARARGSDSDGCTLLQDEEAGSRGRAAESASFNTNITCCINDPNILGTLVTYKWPSNTNTDVAFRVSSRVGICGDVFTVRTVIHFNRTVYLNPAFGCSPATLNYAGVTASQAELREWGIAVAVDPWVSHPRVDLPTPLVVATYSVSTVHGVEAFEEIVARPGSFRRVGTVTPLSDPLVNFYAWDCTQNGVKVAGDAYSVTVSYRTIGEVDRLPVALGGGTVNNPTCNGYANVPLWEAPSVPTAPSGSNGTGLVGFLRQLSDTFAFLSDGVAWVTASDARLYGTLAVIPSLLIGCLLLWCLCCCFGLPCFRARGRRPRAEERSDDAPLLERSARRPEPKMVPVARSPKVRVPKAPPQPIPKPTPKLLPSSRSGRSAGVTLSVLVFLLSVSPSLGWTGLVDGVRSVDVYNGAGDKVANAEIRVTETATMQLASQGTCGGGELFTYTETFCTGYDTPRFGDEAAILSYTRLILCGVTSIFGQPPAGPMAGFESFCAKAMARFTPSQAGWQSAMDEVSEDFDYCSCGSSCLGMCVTGPACHGRFTENGVHDSASAYVCGGSPDCQALEIMSAMFYRYLRDNGSSDYHAKRSLRDAYANLNTANMIASYLAQPSARLWSCFRAAPDTTRSVHRGILGGLFGAVQTFQAWVGVAGEVEVSSCGCNNARHTYTSVRPQTLVESSYYRMLGTTSRVRVCFSRSGSTPECHEWTGRTVSDVTVTLAGGLKIAFEYSLLAGTAPPDQLVSSNGQAVRDGTPFRAGAPSRTGFCWWYANSSGYVQLDVPSLRLSKSCAADSYWDAGALLDDGAITSLGEWEVVKPFGWKGPGRGVFTLTSDAATFSYASAGDITVHNLACTSSATGYIINVVYTYSGRASQARCGDVSWTLEQGTRLSAVDVSSSVPQSCYGLPMPACSLLSTGVWTELGYSEGRETNYQTGGPDGIMDALDFVRDGVNGVLGRIGRSVLSNLADSPIGRLVDGTITASGAAAGGFSLLNYVVPVLLIAGLLALAALLCAALPYLGPLLRR